MRDEDFTCSICGNTLSDSLTNIGGGLVTAVQLPCNHRFHEICIMQWLTPIELAPTVKESSSSRNGLDSVVHSNETRAKLISQYMRSTSRGQRTIQDTRPLTVKTLLLGSPVCPPILSAVKFTWNHSSPTIKTHLLISPAAKAKRMMMMKTRTRNFFNPLISSTTPSIAACDCPHNTLRQEVTAARTADKRHGS